ncbi:MAG: phospholipase D family protein [Pseudomonadota bacterium]|nr:phospholipase D family protein [Pseudomonadota bacterium]
MLISLSTETLYSRPYELPNQVETSALNKQLRVANLRYSNVSSTDQKPIKPQGSHFFHALLLGISLFIAGCASAPFDSPKETSVAIEGTSHSREATGVIEWLDGRTDANGFYPLIEGFDAFGARLALMDAAEVSIDAQYFLMKPDDAGLVFAARLFEAANRGVRVRLLLDDIFTTVEDISLATLDDHPKIEVRIFNPIARKGIYAFNYIGNFTLANRRMHNKAFVVDNQIAVVGGRNIAAEYFQLETSGEFMDFDMLSGGPVVREVSREFDTYWNHRLAVPLEALFKEDNPGKIAERRESLRLEMAEAGNSIYASAIDTPLMKQFFARSLKPYVAESRLLTDDPQKLLEDVSEEQQIVVNEIREVLSTAEEEIVIFTPYFVPRKRGISFIRELRDKGIRVVIVTNSLATNNHTSVHSAYSIYRKDLLRAGVELWEARADAAKITTEDGETRLDHLTLHTKGILIDRKRIFVGSLNLDPRSIDINTEMGLLIDSPELGAVMAEASFDRIPAIAYRLKLGDDNKIAWHATINGQEVVETKEPQTTPWRRFSAWFLKVAPEKQL